MYIHVTNVTNLYPFKPRGSRPKFRLFSIKHCKSNFLAALCVFKNIVLTFCSTHFLPTFYENIKQSFLATKLDFACIYSPMISRLSALIDSNCSFGNEKRKKGIYLTLNY